MSIITQAVNEAMPDPKSLVIDKETLRTAMQRGGCTVEFTKKDGTTRLMFATLNPDYIPAEALPKGTGVHVENPDVLSVYDLDVEGWRSINMKTIHMVTRHTKAAMDGSVAA
jgi:WYL_2, Sm-like SH3 beta-barrel fold